MTSPEVKTRIAQFNAPFLGNILEEKLKELEKQKKKEIAKVEKLIKNKDLITKSEAINIDVEKEKIETKYNQIISDMVAQIQFNALISLSDSITDMHMSVVSLMNKINDNIKAVNKTLKTTNQLLVKKWK